MESRSLQEFAALGSDKVEGVLEALGSSMAADPPDGDVVEGLQGMGLTADQARSMIEWFFDFRIGARNPDLMVRMLEGADADEEAKRVAISAFRRVAERKGRHDGARDIDVLEGPADANFAGYREFVRRHRDDRELGGKYVAFVSGKYQKCGPTEEGLRLEMRGKFSGMRILVGPVSGNVQSVDVKTPRLP